MKSFLRYWLPLLLWMALIFSASADTDSVQRTSRFLGPFLRWLKPDISPEAIDFVRLIVRKGAHMAEFGVLAWLWWRVLHSRLRTREWSARTAWWAFALCALYATSDEFHQLFVKNRGASGWDVLIDCAGAVVVLLLIRFIVRRRAARSSAVGKPAS